MKPAKESRPLVRWLLAQELIIETSGRVSGLGLFLDDVIYIVLPEEHPGPSAEHPIGISQLSLVLSRPSFDGSHEFEMTICSPGGAQVQMKISTQSAAHANRHNIVVDLNGMPVDSCGEYTVTAKCETHNVHSEQVFQVLSRRSRPSSVLLPTERTATPQPAKKPRRRRSGTSESGENE